MQKPQSMEIHTELASMSLHRQASEHSPEVKVLPPPISQQAKEYNNLCITCNSWVPIIDFAFHEQTHGSKILDFLYLAGADTAESEEELDGRIKCTHILNCAGECENIYEDTGKYKYKKLQLGDYIQEDIKPLFQQCWDFINGAKEDGGNVLVHCAMGKSRSATIVISYLMKYNGMNFKSSYDFVRNIRPMIRPNVGYIKQLRELERELFGQNSIQGTDILPIYRFFSGKSPNKLTRK